MMNVQTTQVPQELLDPETPDEVVIRLEARKPETDPTLGIPVPCPDWQATHRLVVLGDSLIDMYNDDITAMVKESRQDGLDWLLLDVAGLLDRLATRRYILDLAARPSWWTRYPLPPQIAALTPVPDSRFLMSGPQGRTEGGIFSLDGVHPTTIAYAILTQEFINIMQAAGVKFHCADGATPQTTLTQIDFDWIIRRDTLIFDPLKSLTGDLKFLSWANELVDWVKVLVAHF